VTALELARKLLEMPDAALDMEVEIVPHDGRGKIRRVTSAHYWQSHVRSVFNRSEDNQRDRVVILVEVKP
jgi:hypothetical protein